MQFDLGKMAPMERYRLLLATVLPRPIAWITTQDAGGAVNATESLTEWPSKSFENERRKCRKCRKCP